MDYRSLAKSASGRWEALQAKIVSTKQDLAAMERELVVLDGILKAIAAGALKGASRPKGKRAAGKGRWKPGGRGRPPRTYLEARKARAERKASEQQLAATAKAREALAANRAAEKAAASG